jgi:hypothetical protein
VLGNLLSTGFSRLRGSGVLCLAFLSWVLPVVACGDPNTPEETVGVLIGVVRDAATETPLEGAELAVGSRTGQSGSDGRFSIDSVPSGDQQLSVTHSGYLPQTVSIRVQAGDTEEVTLELVVDDGPPGPSNISVTTSEDAPGAITVTWDPVDGATGYTLYWGTHSPVDAERGTAILNATSPFVHDELSDGTTYRYVVVAHGPEGDTSPSAEVFATAAGPITIRFVNPTPTQIVQARFVVSVEIRSLFQLTGVTAQVEDLSDELTYIPASDEWEGFFDVGDMPSPSYRVIHYTATDAMGNVARTAVLVRLDRLPVVTMSAPRDDAFAAPSLRVTATCTDDHPAGCESLTISISDGQRTITKAVGQASVDQEISFAEFEGQVVDLRAGGRDVVQDRVHRTPSVIRTVYVDASPHLSPQASAASGTLIDANSTDLLVVGRGGTDTLRLVDRVSGQNTVIYSAATHQILEGALFPGGAIFLTRGGGVSSLREWRNGALSELATQVVSFKAKAPYAIWWEPQDRLVRRDLVGGTNVIVPDGGANTDNDVAATGEVATWVTAPYEILFFDGSTTTQLTDDGDGDFANSAPVTDGIHVVYQRRPLPPLDGTSSIRLADPNGEITLGSNIANGVTSGADYQVNDGWIAFVRPDAGSVRQIWRRSTAGVETQVSVFGSSSRIEAMGPGGEIVFTSEATGVPRRYRAAVDGTPADIGSNLGRAIYIDGQLYVMMGATLLRVN